MSGSGALKWWANLCLVNKALLCAVSVIKASDVQDGATTSSIQREIKCVYGYKWEFLANRFVTFLFECKF